MYAKFHGRSLFTRAGSESFVRSGIESLALLTGSDAIELGLVIGPDGIVREHCQIHPREIILAGCPRHRQGNNEAQ